MSSSDLLLGLIAFIFPPIAVWVKRGICSADSLINICLCVLGGIPGLLHAWYIIAKYPENDHVGVADPEATPVTYVVIHDPHGQNRVGNPTTRQVNVGYATMSPAGIQSNLMAANHQQSPIGGNGGHVPPTYSEAIKGDHKIQT
ncbi:BgTH12-00228 [Blumeria graminis f. sp. triticale]|uniref:Bgt-3312 n=3 Tax=Blumeria graminis TaxID=34373 RepID=A0A061HLN2_BLUGR|nr:hypothetical protein BGT96224_3312 [Blumeria graminis f. sp. tritici 96224]CAD6504723.1 BgTH12-00228 [Blumeria graminis f. sp. triticale]VCU39479.1 Bgt-3312 [Blumeria graminis f. sp. tritici]